MFSMFIWNNSRLSCLYKSWCALQNLLVPMASAKKTQKQTKSSRSSSSAFDFSSKCKRSPGQILNDIDCFFQRSWMTIWSSLLTFDELCCALVTIEEPSGEFPTLDESSSELITTKPVVFFVGLLLVLWFGRSIENFLQVSLHVKVTTTKECSVEGHE